MNALYHLAFCASKSDVTHTVLSTTLCCLLTSSSPSKNLLTCKDSHMCALMDAFLSKDAPGGRFPLHQNNFFFKFVCKFQKFQEQY